MLETVIEILLDLVLEGAVEATCSKRVPMPIRILLACVLGLVFLGIFGLLFWIGFKNKSIGVIVIAAVFLLACVIAGYVKIRKYRLKRKNGQTGDLGKR